MSSSKTTLSEETTSRRDFLKSAVTATSAAALPLRSTLGLAETVAQQQSESRSSDYVLRIGASPVEINPKQNTAYPGAANPGPVRTEVRR